MCQKAAQEWRIIMGILTRFKDIMSANINALLDKCEDPEKMIDQYMRNLESDLGKVKAETASVMAEETRCKRELDECTADVAKYQSYAEKALKAGNEADARTFLEKKQQLLQISEGESFFITGVGSSQMLIPVDNRAAVTMNDIELVFPTIEKEVVGVLWITTHHINVYDFIIGENFSEHFAEIVPVKVILWKGFEIFTHYSTSFNFRPQ